MSLVAVGSVLAAAAGAGAAGALSDRTERRFVAVLSTASHLDGARDGAHGDRRTGSSGVSRPWTSRVLAGSLLVLVPALVPGVLGLVLAVPVAVSGHRFLDGLPDQRVTSRHRVMRRQLPMVLELLAAALLVGATTDSALSLAAGAVGPPTEDVFREVVAGLRLGASAAEAWQPATGVEALRPLARVAVRSQASGAAMAVACTELARRERSRRLLEAHAAVKRAGVWAVLPLALCFLPAFVLVGVVPLVVGLLQSLVL